MCKKSESNHFVHEKQENSNFESEKKAEMIKFKLYSLLAILFALSSYCLNAQNSDLAKPGPGGIYLFLGKAIPSGKTVTAYSIERKQENEDWKTIAEVRAPRTFAEFLNRINEAKILLPAQPLPGETRLKQIYEKAILTGSIDSLKGWVIQYPLRLALGLMYHDATAKTGKGFQYRVSSINANGETGHVNISASIDMPYTITFDDIQLAESSKTDYGVIIKWRSAGNKPGPLFMVLKLDGQMATNAGGRVGHYSRNDTTYYTFQDTLDAKELAQDLKYFMTPYDLLGNAGKSSAVVQIGQDNFNKAYFMKTRATVIPDDFLVRISWHFSDPITVSSMDLYRSNELEKGYVRIASFTREDTVYTDEKVYPNRNYYYFLQANSRSGMRFKQSEKLTAVLGLPSKPLAPALTSATAQIDGIHLAIEITDPKTTGIRVFRKYGSTGEFIAASELLERPKGNTMVFVDSINQLSADLRYSYAVRAESKFRMISELSNIIEVKPISGNGPQPPAFLKAIVDESKVQLSWENSRVSDPDIKGYLISRQDENPGNQVVLAGKSSDYVANFLIDSTLKMGTVYTYTVQCVDAENHVGTGKAMLALTLQNGNPIAPPALTLRNEKAGIRLSWGTVVYPGMQLYRVYRSADGQKPEVLITLPSTVQDFMDSSAQKGVNYIYFVSTLNTEGKESAGTKSEVVTP